jgi:uncharacterized membrane protein (DUF2068 family)
MDQRPKTVPIVAAFLFAATAIAVAAGVSLLFPNPVLDRLWTLNKPGEATFRSLGRVSGLPLLLIGVGTCAAAVGLVQGKKWAWWLAVVLFAINGCADIVGLIVAGNWVRSGSGLVICAAFLYALSRSRVTAYFKPDP